MVATIGHAARAPALESGHEHRFSAQGAAVVVGQRLLVEDLVVDGDHAAALTQQVAAEHEALGLAGRRPVEGLGGGRSPVDEQGLEALVGQADAPDVVAVAGLEVDAPEAQRSAADVVAGQRALQQVDLGVALEQGLAMAGLVQPHLGQAGRGVAPQLGQAAVEPVDVPLLGGSRVVRRRAVTHPSAPPWSRRPARSRGSVSRGSRA
jgi:hypothetical protein